MTQIVHISAEIAPIAKVGGLGDVILGLSRELVRQGHRVSVVLPKYTCIEEEAIEDLEIAMGDLWCRIGESWQHNTVWTGLLSGIRVYLIEPSGDYFAREKIYGYPDDTERFLYFSKVALDFLMRAGNPPDVLHLHDWMAAAFAPLYWEQAYPTGFQTALVTTVHNMEHQGRCTSELIDWVGLTPKASHTNLLKEAIETSHWVTTVSPTYAREILTPEFGFGLDETMRTMKEKTTGILNGLDLAVWSPDHDPYLPAPYTAENLKPREESRNALRKQLGLDTRETFMVGCVARLTPQKGIELIKRALFKTLEEGGQFVLLGTTANPDILSDFEALKARYDEHPDVHLELRQNEELVHRIYAATDLFIVPSRFEPCGLTQLIAMRYGSVPVVRHTGGLVDTVFDANTSEQPNGFVFDAFTEEAFDEALIRAINVWRNESARWKAIRAAGMSAKMGWRGPAEAYLAVYSRAIALASAEAQTATGSQG